ncbi:MAG: carbon-nitrogen hydrolase family protein [Pseudomonadota bacterium]
MSENKIMNKVAAIQISSTNNVDENLQTATKLIAEACMNGAKLIVLPEMFAIMGFTATDSVAVQETFGEGKIQNFLASQAKKHHVWIVGGTIPVKSENPNKIRAACLVYNDQGQVVARYDKAHLFDATICPVECYRESNTAEPGDELVIVETPFGKLGLAVCYDLRFSEIFIEFMKQGVELIAVSAAFVEKTGIAHWHALLRARAIENFSYVIASNQWGTHASQRKTYGHSLIVDPWGKIIDEMQQPANGVVYGEVDLDYLREKRKSIPVLAHMKKLTVSINDGISSVKK